MYQFNSATRFNEYVIQPNVDQWLSDIATAVAAAKIEDPEKQKHHLILYTDGGCRPSQNGIGGWGIHGYLYLKETPKQGHGCKGFTPTDRGYLLKEGASSKEGAVTVIHYIDGCGSLVPESTNNEAELVALMNGLELVIQLRPATVHFKLDSEYVLKGCTQWLQNWVRGNWRKGDGSEISNRQRWMAIHNLLQQVADICPISWDWVKGHSNSVGNNAADEQATSGIFSGKNGFMHHRVSYHPPKGYWSPEHDINPFLMEKYWWFTTGPVETPANGQWVYHMTDGDDDLAGKPQADTCYSVISLPEENGCLSMLRAHQTKVAAANGIPVCAVLDNVFRPRIYRELQTYGGLYLHKPGWKQELEHSSGAPITREKTPPKLVFRAIESLLLLENVLTDISSKDWVPDEASGKRLTDITDVIYEVTTVKNKAVTKVKLPAGADSTAFKVPVRYNCSDEDREAVITLTLGIDAPRRNLLSAIADSVKKVYVLTWPEYNSRIAFRYALLIQSDIGCGIWASVHSNLHVVAHLPSAITSQS